jgi:hypothetical protein
MSRTNWGDISSFRIAPSLKPVAAEFTLISQPMLDLIHVNFRQSCYDLARHSAAKAVERRVTGAIRTTRRVRAAEQVGYSS